MSYWAGYGVTALVLNEDEFKSFVEEYKKQNPTELDVIEDMTENELFPDEYMFARTSKKGNRPYGDFFDITPIRTDETSGALLRPYRNNGKLNVYGVRDECGHFIKNEDYVSIPMHDGNCYFIAADKQLDSPLAFMGQRYESYEEMLREFKDKIESYLPKNFDWDEHIGSFTYAAFA